MQVYTSYFSYLRVHRLPDGIVPIAVCDMPPPGFSGGVYKKLSPPENYLEQFKEDGDVLKYKFCYKTYVLDKLVFCKVMLDLQKIALSKDSKATGFCLVSFESYKNFNHRQMISDWFNTFGIETTEYISESA